MWRKEAGTINEKPKDYYRVFAPGVPIYRDVSERFTSEVDAKRLKREILMAYPATTVRIEKADESSRAIFDETAGKNR
jgi:hypothetical protein